MTSAVSRCRRRAARDILGVDVPIRIATVVALIILGWGFARDVGRALGPVLFRRLDPATAGTVGFLIRLEPLRRHGPAERAAVPGRRPRGRRRARTSTPAGSRNGITATLSTALLGTMIASSPLENTV